MADSGPGDSNDLDVEDVFLKGSSFSPRKKDPHVTGEIIYEEEMSAVALHTPEKDGDSSNRGVLVTREPLDFKPLCLRHFFNNGIIQSPIQPKGSQANLSPGLLFVTSSPRVIQKELQDGSFQQYAINTPLIRKSRLLEFRRITSELDNSLSICFSGSRKRQIENRRPLQKVYSSDQLSDSLKSSSSMETDDETAQHIAGLKSDFGLDDGAGPLCSEKLRESVEEGHGKGWFVRPANNVSNPHAADGPCLQESRQLYEPFEKLLLRQGSDLFDALPDNETQDSNILDDDHLTKDSRCLQKRTTRIGLIPLLVKDSEQGLQNEVPEAHTLQLQEQEDKQTEYTIKRRFNSQRRQKENLDAPGPAIQSVGKSCRKGLADRCNEEIIKIAVEKMSILPGVVISDASMPYSLPCFMGEKHEELVYISCETLSRLLKGEFRHVVQHFIIIDCRYPYEYNGGHIRGAVNIYDVGSIEDIMGWKPESNKHMVLIFHCEFSSHRGPNMMKMLRNTDRKRHLHCYPFLCYPEIYLLQGGYSHFYRHYKGLCEPQQYVEMSHPEHWQELRFYKSLYKPSTWHGKSVDTNSIIL